MVSLYIAFLSESFWLKCGFPYMLSVSLSLDLVSETQHEDVISRHSGLVIAFISPVGHSRG